jgi:metal-responsive CopG/Arc/MetJ family transcriptional regulator
MVTRKSRSEDRHVPGRQISISARLNKDEFDRLEAVWRAIGMPSRRQAIITAIREFLDRHENEEDPQ